MVDMIHTVRANYSYEEWDDSDIGDVLSILKERASQLANDIESGLGKV